jgi:hypothetical protein
MTLESRRLISTREAAKYIGVGKSTLEKLRFDGDGPVYIKASPGRIVYAVEDLEDYLNARRCQPTRPEPAGA